MLNRFLLLICCLLSIQLCDAQIDADEAIIELDSLVADTVAVEVVKKKKKKFFLRGILKEPYPSPRKAALLSLMLPGAGQAYNKKYWKIPIVYAGVGSLVYAINWNGTEYRKFRDAYRYRVDNLECTTDRYVGILDDASLKNWRDFYFKNYQLSYIGFGVVYLLNGVEAFVDAHLLSFNVDDDLSLKLHPNTQIMHDGSTSFSLGFSLHERNPELEIHPGFLGL